MAIIRFAAYWWLIPWLIAMSPAIAIVCLCWSMAAVFRPILGDPMRFNNPLHHDFHFNEKWHRKFLWIPTTMDDGLCHWLCFVERRGTWITLTPYISGYWRYEYRDKTGTVPTRWISFILPPLILVCIGLLIALCPCDNNRPAVKSQIQVEK